MSVFGTIFELSRPSDVVHSFKAEMSWVRMPAQGETICTYLLFSVYLEESRCVCVCVYVCVCVFAMNSW